MNQSYDCKIITGQYKAADTDAQRMLRDLFGENAEHRYEIYFHWYNTIHELGHAELYIQKEEENPPRQVDTPWHWIVLVNKKGIVDRRFGEWRKIRIY